MTVDEPSILLKSLYKGIEETLKNSNIRATNHNVGNNAKIGESKDSEKGIALLGRGIIIGDGVTVNGGKIIDKNLIKGEN